MTLRTRTLPHNDDRFFLTDGGQETTLIFHKGIELPEFASFVLLKDRDGREALRDYYRCYLAVAKTLNVSLILETATWRANPDWAGKLGCSPADLKEMNRSAVSLIEGLRPEFEEGDRELIISGCLGPRGDGYVAGSLMRVEEAAEYHSLQIGVLKEAGVDLVTALTLNYENEAIGIANAAADAGLPAVISFTVETDGRLPNGSSLEAAIRRVDGEATVPPAYFMINCAHPTHFADVLDQGEGWQRRIRGTRVNASKMSHAELDEAEELDEGNPSELAADHSAIGRALPNLNVAGGCCGTDERHVFEIARFLISKETL